MSRHLDPDRLYKSKKTIIRKLKNGKVKAAVCAAEELLELKPTAVTLVLGTEELQKGSAASVITDMKEVIAVIKKVFPHSTVLISEVMPYPSPKNLQRKAEYVNKALGIWEKSMERIKVTEHNSLWENKNPFEKQNIHLTESEGTAALVTNLKHVLNPVLGLPPYYIQGRKQAENTTKKYPFHYHEESKNQEYRGRRSNPAHRTNQYKKEDEQDSKWYPRNIYRKYEPQATENRHREYEPQTPENRHGDYEPQAPKIGYREYDLQAPIRIWHSQSPHPDYWDRTYPHHANRITLRQPYGSRYMQPQHEDPRTYSNRDPYRMEKAYHPPRYEHY